MTQHEYFESFADESGIEMSAHTVDLYARTGYVLLGGLFSLEEIATIKSALPEILDERSERTVMEASQLAVRSVYGVHQHHPIYRDLARHPRILGLVRQLLRSSVYVYQSKVNTKAAVDGDVWPWHQDYVFWQREDFMPEARALTVAVFLDDVTELNGPILLIPGSHRDGVLPFETQDGPAAGYDPSVQWLPNLIARLKYTIERQTLIDLARERGVVAAKGRAGAALFFDCNLAHASLPNLSPVDRTLALLTYNPVDNAPVAAALHRPEFLVSRDTRPLVPVDDRIFKCPPDAGAANRGS
jgi:L-proline 4-hydroxylase